MLSALPFRLARRELLGLLLAGALAVELVAHLPEGLFAREQFAVGVAVLSRVARLRFVGDCTFLLASCWLRPRR